jgi:AcrR family transcriptional regulator
VVVVPSLRGVRERARADVTAEIVAAARRQLSEVGPADLSLRAVARELDVVSSAVYRYVASRDELLTLLIVEAYDSLGEHVERVVAASAGRPPAERWVDAALAVRSWATEHRHEYALVYGTPVPGYDAPDRTTASGTRVSFALVGIVRDAWHAGLLFPPADPTITSELADDLEQLRTALDLPAPESVLVATLAAWSQLFGLVTFELFGQTRGVVEHHEELFRATATMMAAGLGLRSDVP